MVVLDNKILHVEIDEKGTEIRKVLHNGKNQMWSGDANVWSGVAPILFPICSKLRDGKFTLDGKEYFMGMHGFAKTQMAQVENITSSSVTFLFKDNEETLKQYPWHFELRVTYILKGSSIDVLYEVKNTSESTMYYSIGAHESYACDTGVEDYDLIFEREETLYSYELENGGLSYKRNIILKDSKVLPLYEKYFEIDALIFKDVKSRFVTLRNRKTGEKASVEFQGFDYLLLWQKQGAPYLCIEPWAGMCPNYDGDYDITKKEGILKLEKGQTNTFKHTLFY